MRGTGIVAELVGEPDLFRIWIVNIRYVLCCLAVVGAQVTEDQTVRLQVIDRPWFDVIDFGDFEPSDSQLSDECGEDAFLAVSTEDQG